MTTAVRPGAIGHRIALADTASSRSGLSAQPLARQVAKLQAWLVATGRHGLWIALWSLVGWGGTLLMPVLLDRPFLLMMLSPRALFVAMAVDSASLVTFVIFGTLRLGVTDASHFIIGRRFPRSAERPEPRPTRNLGHRILGLTVRVTDSAVRWLCGHGAKAGTVLFFRPNGKYLAVAGSYGVSPAVAGLSSVLGTMIYLASFHLGIGLLT